jgi:hypothetical protein
MSVLVLICSIGGRAGDTEYATRMDRHVYTNDVSTYGTKNISITCQCADDRHIVRAREKMRVCRVRRDGYRTWP